MAKIPPQPSPELSTDAHWEAWGRRDPYFGVITLPQFRRDAMTSEAREEFFLSGRQHAQFVMDVSRQFVDPAFAPKSILEFGCGVGRVLVAFAEIAPKAVGVDISPSMLAEARRNCDEHGRSGVELRSADDRLSAVTETFDLVHTFIVLQHIPVDRVRVILDSLVSRIAPRGIGAIHLVYSRMGFAPHNGLAPPPPPPPVPEPKPAWGLRREPAPPPPPANAPPPDPEIQMNPYHMNEALFALQRAGILRFHVEFTDHGGELGAFLFFQRPAAP